MIRVLAVAGLLALTAAGADAGVQSPHLVPFDHEFAEMENLRPYFVAARDALLGGRSRAEVQVLVVPSFQPEWSLHLASENGRTRVVYSVMKRHLWLAMAEVPAGPDGTVSAEKQLEALGRAPRDVARFTAPLGGPVAEEVGRVWKSMLARARRPANGALGLDGTTYFVFRWTPSGYESGTTWSPAADTPAGEFAALIDALKAHAQATAGAWAPSEAALAARTARLLRIVEPPPIGLDHVPVAVRDLEGAAARYRALGFALKPGRPHDNGIRNVHVKFPDGAGIELLTAPQAVDALSAHYVGHLRGGEGPAFVSFHARDTGRLHTALREGGYAFQQDGETTKLLAPELAFLFFVRDNRSPTDRPEHFAHGNGATALSAVWIATEHGESLARLLVLLGGRQERRQVSAPDPVEATVVSLAEGEVVILPGRHQLVPGRPVIGARFRVPDPAKVGRLLAQAGIEPRAGTRAAEPMVVGPGSTHGLWLQFGEHHEPMDEGRLVDRLYDSALLARPRGPKLTPAR
jgi:hypothetical protein